MITLVSERWGGLGVDGREAWVEFVRAHGLEPNEVGFPLTIDDDQDPPQMRVRILLRNDSGARYVDPDTGDVAVREETVTVRYPIPAQRPA